MKQCRIKNQDPIEQLKVRNLWHRCFHDTEEYMNFYFTWKTKDNTVYGIYDQEQLVSMIHLNPYRLSVRGNEVNSYYIVGVATDENYRKRGLMRQLLGSSLEKMYEENITFSYLMPASEAIYLPFDFRIITKQKRMSIPVASIEQKEEIVSAASLKDQKGQMTFLTKEDDLLLSKLVDYANQTLRDQDVYTIRDLSYYKRMLAELETFDGKLLVHQKDHQIVGYMAFGVEEGKIEVIEFLGEKEAMTDYVEEYVLSWTKKNKYEYPIVEPTQTPTIMARIVNLKQFFPLVKAKGDTTIVFQVKDPILSYNNGIYLVEWKNGDCNVTKCDENEYHEVDIVCDISDLTQFMFGKGQINSHGFQLQSSQAEDKLAMLDLLEQVHLNEIV